MMKNMRAKILKTVRQANQEQQKVLDEAEKSRQSVNNELVLLNEYVSNNSQIVRIEEKSQKKWQDKCAEVY